MVQHDELAGLRVHPGAHELGGGGDHRVGLFRVDEVVELAFAFGVVARDLHHVVRVVFANVSVGIRQRLAHAGGVVDVFAKHDGLGVAVGGLEVFGDLGGHHFVALLQNQFAVHVGGVVDAVFDQVAVLVGHALRGPPAKGVFVQVHPHDFVGRQEAVFNTLLEAVGVNRLAKVFGVGGVLGFFGRGGQAHLGGAAKVGEDVAPGRVFVGAATVALVHHDQVKEVGAELFVDVAFFFGARHGLVKREVNLVTLVHQLGGFVDGQVHLFDRDLALCVDRLDAFGVGAELGHRAFEGPEVIDHGLVDQDVTVGQKQDALGFGAGRVVAPGGFPQAVDDLERGVGFAGARGHDQQDAFLPGRDHLDRAVDGCELVVARGLAGVIVVLGHAAHLGRPALPGAIAAPQFLRRGELIQSDVFLQHAIGHRGVAKHKAVAVARKTERHVQQLGVVDGLCHARAHGLVVVFGLDHRDGDVGLEEQRVVGLEDGGCIAVGRFAPYADAPCSQPKLMKYLRHRVPPGLLDGGRDEAGADVAFGELFLVQAGARVGELVAKGYF